MKFNKNKLALAVIFTTSAVYANENVAHLGVIEVVADNAGTKNVTNVVTRNEVERSTQTDLRGLLSAEPSINFGGGNGGTSQWTTIRGMGQDQIDIKVDNAYSDSQMFHHEGRFMLDPSLIKRVNVQKGAGSASAGIGATSGSIEATTYDAKDLLKEGQSFGFKLNAGVSSNKGHKQGATVYGKAGAVDALVAGNWVYEQNYQGGQDYRNLLGQRQVQNSALNQRGVLAKIGVDINENHRLVLSHRQEQYHGERALREEFDFTNTYLSKAQGEELASGQRLSNVKAGKRRGKETFYVLDAQNNYVVDAANNDPRYRISTTNTTNLEWAGKQLGFVTEAKANVYKMDRKREEPAANSTQRVETVGANVNFDSAIGENHLLKYGVNYRQQVGKPTKLYNASFHQQKKQDTGVYVEGIWGFGPVTLTTGGRYDHFNFKAPSGKEVSKGHFNPSAGLIYEVSPDLSFNTNLNFATRSPRLYEIMLAGGFKRGPADPLPVTVADDLTAEKARNTEIGFNYRLNDELSVEGSYFWQRVKNAHSMVNLNASNPRAAAHNQIYNGALLRNQGYELSASYKKDGFKARLGVADSAPEIYGNVADNTVYAVKTGRTWTAGLAYQFAAPNVEIGWKGRFVESEIGTPSRGSSNATKVKQASYNLHDFYASWTANQNLTLNFAIDNAFNKTYRSHSQRAGQSSLVGKGRDFRLNANYTF